MSPTIQDALTAEVKTRVAAIQAEEDRIESIVNEVLAAAQQKLRNIGIEVALHYRANYYSRDGEVMITWGVPRETHTVEFSFRVGKRTAPKLSCVTPKEMLRNFWGDRRSVVEKLVNDYGFSLEAVGERYDYRVDILICRSATYPDFAAWLEPAPTYARR